MKMIFSGAALAIVAAITFVGYSIFKPPAQASAPITAAPVLQATATTAVPAIAAATSAPAVAVQPATPAYGAAAQAAAPAAAAQPAAPAAAAHATVPSIFEIDQTASSAKFIVEEVLRGSPYTVVGTTNQVAGQVAADLKDIDAAKVGEIRINARTLKTDSEGRNRMLQNQILQTGQHEYITFTPTRMVGLPEAATVGQAFTFQMVGNLTIKGQQRETTFDVTVTPTANNQLEGAAKTTIKYADWGISIPQVPSVTGVSDQLGLELNFVAKS